MWRWWQKSRRVGLALTGLAAAPALAAGADAQATSVDAKSKPLTVNISLPTGHTQTSQQAAPASAVSVSGATLQDRGVTTARDLQETVPGLYVSEPNARQSSFTLRGLGSSAANEGIESSVALYMDGVYLGRPGMSIGDLIDIDHVEVARGPQGFLSGKNATAGAVSIFTRKPLFTPEAELETSLGSYGYQQLRGTVTGPLSSTLAGRLTAYQTSRDGLVTNRYNGEKVNDIFRQGLRGQLLWTPVSTLSARLIAEYGNVDENCCAFPLIGKPGASIAAADAYMGYQRVSGDPANRQTDQDIQPRQQIQQRALSTEINWDITPDTRLVSLSAFRQYALQSLTDDQTSMSLVNANTSINDTQYSQELRLESHWRKVDTTVGGFFLDQTTQGDDLNTLGSQLSDWVFGGLIRQRLPFATVQNTGPVLHLLIPPATLAGMQVNTPYQQHSTSAAGFGTLTWHATDQLDLSAGLRYTYEQKQAEVSRTRSGGNPSASPLSLTNVLTPVGNLLGVNLSGLTFDNLLNQTAGGPYARSMSLTEGDWSGSTGLAWHWSPDVMTYLTAAHGVKSGGMNLGVPGASAQPMFKPEVADSVELGLKSLFLQDQLMLNLAAYYTRVTDYQALTFDGSQTLLQDPRLDNLLNIGLVTMRGVDMDFQALLPWRLTLRGGIAYNDAVTNDFTNAPSASSQQGTSNLSGQPLANAPRWQGNVALRKDWSLTSRMSAYLATDYWFRSVFNATTERSASGRIDGYGVIGARLGLHADNDRWDWSVWGRNLANTRYISAVVPVYGIGENGGIAGDPRMIGTTLRLKWR